MPAPSLRPPAASSRSGPQPPRPEGGDFGPSNLRIDAGRLLSRLEALAAIGATPEGGCRRLALSDEDRAARDWLAQLMREVGLEVRVDRIGNIFGITPHPGEAAPIMIGSHIDTVPNGGRYDGALGVLAGMEVVQRLRETGFEAARPIVVAAFTNEEGARFQPDMMGSLAFAGGLDLAAARATLGTDGAVFGEELDRIGYAGATELGAIRPAAYVELHIEQGPILDREGGRIGAVTAVQGIRWREIELVGDANHAGTTPMAMRRDAGLAAARIACFAAELASTIEDQVATVGRMAFTPDVINVVPGTARLTLDLRNPDEDRLAEAERRILAFANDLAAEAGLRLTARSLARFAPVPFDDRLVAMIEEAAQSLDLPVRRMPSGAGHDAQMLAWLCPAAMIFVPSRDGRSHNPAEFTAPEDLAAGADVLLRTVARLAAGQAWP